LPEHQNRQPDPQGSWLCVLTTGAGVEGQPGQHVVSTTSTDHGKAWSPIVEIEPLSGPEASRVMPITGKFDRTRRCTVGIHI
jgi:hypothetical protein